MPWETVIGLEVHVQLLTRYQDVLRLRQPVRRRAQHQRLSGVPGTARRAAGAQRACDPAGDPRRPGARVQGARDQHLCPQELLLSRPAQGLPDLPVRSAAGDAVAPSPSNRRSAAGSAIGVTRLHVEEDAGKSLHDRLPGPDRRRPQSRRHPARRDRERAGAAQSRRGSRLPDDPQADPALLRDQRLQHGGRVAAGGREHLHPPAGRHPPRHQDRGEEHEQLRQRGAGAAGGTRPPDRR